MSSKGTKTNGNATPAWEAPRWLRTAVVVLLAVGVVAVLVLALRPQPVSVDLAEVTRGVVEVAVEEDGRTRVRDRYALAAPVSATLRRITLEAGDRVEEGEVLAWLDGPESPLTDPRTEAQLRARLAAAEAGVARARALAEAAEAGLVEAREAVRRQEISLELGGGSAAALERAQALLRAREAELRSAGFGVQAAQGEVEDIRLALRAPAPVRPGGGTLTLRAPVTGTVLRVHRESGGVVGPGEALVEVGDPSALEVVVDLLSADAVRVPEGAEARISGWGGDGELPARVRRVEPAGFTRVSALGIEEQRVNVILDPLEAPEWARLGDGFRVEVRVILDRAEDVLRVPAGAVFRLGEGWAVFRAANGRLEEVPVEVGRRSQAEVEIRSGLSEGDRVVVYPADRAEDGARYRSRSGT
jgi:HlyD family secretion protein